MFEFHIVQNIRQKCFNLMSRSNVKMFYNVYRMNYIKSFFFHDLLQPESGFNLPSGKHVRAMYTPLNPTFI